VSGIPTLTVDVAGYDPNCAAVRHGTWMGRGTEKQPRSAGLKTFKYDLLADPGVASQFSQLTQNFWYLNHTTGCSGHAGKTADAGVVYGCTRVYLGIRMTPYRHDSATLTVIFCSRYLQDHHRRARWPGTG
jgi:hypothetical protein